MKINWVPTKTINQDRVQELLSECQSTNHFTNNGPVTKKLEDVVRQKLKVDDSKDIIIVSNGTVALWVAVAAIELSTGRHLRWATQSFTFPPSAQGTLESVKIVDIDLEGGLELYQGLENEVDGIIVTNIFGNLVNIKKYEDWCQKFNKYLIFDNAATAYSFYKGKNCVNYGNSTTLSFHHTKPIGFGEGGAVIIDKEFSSDLKRLINFGIDQTHGWHRWGGNYKLSDISAAYIVQHLEQIDHIYTHTKHLAEEASKCILKKNGKARLFPNFSDEIGLLSCLTILFEDEEESNLVIERLANNDIFSRKYYYPLDKSINANKIFRQIVCVPLHYCMTIEQLKYMLTVIFN